VRHVVARGFPETILREEDFLVFHLAEVTELVPPAFLVVGVAFDQACRHHILALYRTFLETICEVFPHCCRQIVCILMLIIVCEFRCIDALADASTVVGIAPMLRVGIVFVDQLQIVRRLNMVRVYFLVTGVACLLAVGVSFANCWSRVVRVVVLGCGDVRIICTTVKRSGVRVRVVLETRNWAVRSWSGGRVGSGVGGRVRGGVRRRVRSGVRSGVRGRVRSGVRGRVRSGVRGRVRRRVRRRVGGGVRRRVLGHLALVASERRAATGDAVVACFATALVHVHTIRSARLFVVSSVEALEASVVVDGLIVGGDDPLVGIERAIFVIAIHAFVAVHSRSVVLLHSTVAAGKVASEVIERLRHVANATSRGVAVMLVREADVVGGGRRRVGCGVGCGVGSWVGGRIWGGVGGRVRGGVRRRVSSRVRGRVRGGVGGRVWSRVRSGVRSRVGGRVSGGVRGRVRSGERSGEVGWVQCGVGCRVRSRAHGW